MSAIYRICSTINGYLAGKCYQFGQIYSLNPSVSREFWSPSVWQHRRQATISCDTWQSEQIKEYE